MMNGGDKMSPFKTILAACGLIGAVLLVLCSGLCMIAPKFMDNHDVLKKGMLIIGAILVVIGVAAIFIFSER